MILQKIKKSFAIAGFFAVTLFASCNKQPIGPTGPDPIAPALPGQFLTYTELKALYTGTSDVTIPSNTKKTRGVVISNSANEAAGNYRLQDENGGGLYLYSVAGSPVYPQGTVLEINPSGGTLTMYNGDLELKSVPQTQVVKIGGTIDVQPKVATISQIIANRTAWSSTLVKINNITSITQASSNATGVTYNVTDATGTISMFVRTASNINVNTSGTSITGYISIFNTTTQIGIRTAADIQ
jgi:hypothetical protein